MKLNHLQAPQILDSLADGAYVTDAARRILFWNRAAEEATGWTREEVVGKSCSDNILVHIDKDGHPLCGEEFCPLYRAMATNTASQEPLLVYAQTKDGSRLPVEVTVAPIRDSRGTVIGGIEVFRDLSDADEDLRCAQLIQQHSLSLPPPDDPRLLIAARSVPHGLVGGDFYRAERLEPDLYGILIADVTGHGVASALYTMQLRSMWEDYRRDLKNPPRFFGRLNRSLHVLAQPDDHFATAAYFLADLAGNTLRCVNAGHPPSFFFRAGGDLVRLSPRGAGLGLFPETEFEEAKVPFQPGDTLALYTDGAIEAAGADGEELGEDGLADLLRRTGIGGADFSFDRLEEALLRFSGLPRLVDDLTVLTARRPAAVR